MVGNVRFRAARAPVVVVGLEGDVQRHVALVPVAEAAAAGALATAVVVGDGVMPAVRGVLWHTE